MSGPLQKQGLKQLIKESDNRMLSSVQKLVKGIKQDINLHLEKVR